MSHEGQKETDLQKKHLSQALLGHFLNLHWDLHLSFVVARSKTQKVQELQHLCNLHFDSSQEHLEQTEHLESFKQTEQCFKGPGFEQNLHSNFHFLLFPLKALGLPPPEEAALPLTLLLRFLPKERQAGTSES